MNKMFFNSNFSIKNAEENDEGSLKIEGFASTDSKDRDGDVISPDAWSSGIKDYLKNPIILYSHDYKSPIGKAIEVTPIQNGLKVTAEISKAAGMAYELIKGGILKTFSVGFRFLDGNYNKRTESFIITDLELFEISVVAVPANSDAIFSVAKSFSNEEEFNLFKKKFSTEKNEMADETYEVELDLEALKKEIKQELLAEQSAKKSAEVAEAKRKEEMEAYVKQAVISAGESGAEKLRAEIEKRLEDDKSTLEDLKTEIKEKASELDAINRSKIEFNDRAGSQQPSKVDIAEAVLTAKALKMDVKSTKAGKRIIEKVGPNVPDANWETIWSSNVYDEMRQELIVEPLFNSITMSTPVLHVPSNPDATTATWIDPANYGATTSTGTAADQALTDTTLTAYKLAAKSWNVLENNEDSIIPLVPLIQNAIVRRMARAADIALLRGQASGASDPITGLDKVATTAGGAYVTTLSIGGAAVIDTADLRTARQALGKYGLDPSELVYIVSQEAYYDLLNDTNLLTLDKAGPMATLWKGQIGFVHGSPVIVSGEFEAKAATKTAAVAVNVKNFLVGSQRGLTTESDYDVEKQSTLFIATRRLAFKEMEGTSASILQWVA